MDRDNKIVMFDPRGYFGKKELYGDPDYDFAKVYYSVVGSYDIFNRRRFMLDMAPTMQLSTFRARPGGISPACSTIGSAPTACAGSASCMP